MSNQESNQQPETQNDSQKNPQNKLLLIIASILVVCICVGAVLAVITTVRKDNPTNPTTSTVDTAALAQQMKDTVAMTLGNHSLNAVELNYYYIDIVNSFCSEYYYYIYYYGMINTTKPLNEQYFDEKAGTTWADYFLSIAKENIKSTYLLYDLAIEHGYTLSDANKATLEELKKSIQTYAETNKYSSADSYLESIFGYGAELETYLAYQERAMLADAYYGDYSESLTYTDEQLREFEKDKAHEFNSYSYATYYLDAAKFLTGGTEGSDGKVTYTDEQIAASVKAAEEAAKTLDGSICQDTEAFKDLVLSLEINSSLDSVSITEKKDILYAGLDTTFQKWVADESRTYGEVTIIPKVTKSGSGENATETINGYYIVWFGGVNDNQFAMKDVRHLLVLFKDKDGKTYTDGISTFTDEQKAAAKAEAEKLLAEWKAGEMTEDSFAALAIKKSEDPGSASIGGLYENIYPGQMVESFENWCYDADRQVGDTDLVESVYGYHVMYFVGDSDMTYRDFMVSYSMRTEDLSAWHKALVESAELVDVCLDYCELDMKLSG